MGSFYTVYFKASDKQERCPNCNWDTSGRYALANSKAEANKKFRTQTEWLCADCLAQELYLAKVELHDEKEEMWK